MAGLSDTVDEVLEVLFKLNADGISIVLIEHIMQAVVRFSQPSSCSSPARKSPMAIRTSDV
jgi:branched-chain amino acid transport system ATP-binding protein